MIKTQQQKQTNAKQNIKDTHKQKGQIKCYIAFVRKLLYKQCQNLWQSIQ